jgi:hypothetical protein
MATADALTLVAEVRDELRAVQASLVDQHLAARVAGDAERERLAHDLRSQIQGVLAQLEELGSVLEDSAGRAS